VRLERSLVLNRYFHGLLGASGLEDLKALLARLEEGPAADGQSHYYAALAGVRGLQVPAERLREYDARIVAYERRLAQRRAGFVLKYFQYLSLLYTEMFLDRLTEAPEDLRAEVNTHLVRLAEREPSMRDVPAFQVDDLRRLAFFMATGSGKTLLLHVNLWQVLHYLAHGRHPEALVRRPDGRREFDSLLLVTPNEGLSEQHLKELTLSGIDAVHLTQDQAGARPLAPRVRVVEISKLAEEASREGVSIPLEALGGANLVFVDEGHKGTGSLARAWKSRQLRLGKDGFLLEYSATFAQSIAAAGRAARRDLLAEYGKSILFDYSYRHFYDDGYGKDFRVLNLQRARESQAQTLLLGGLLAYYQQRLLFRRNREAYRPYNLEAPLWVFLGSSVNAVYSRAGRKRSDVAVVVEFLRRFLEDPRWAEDTMRSLLAGESGFIDPETGMDVFTSRLDHLARSRPRQLYKSICEDVFHGTGGLEVWDLKSTEGELGLRVPAPEGKETPYFGVINIGDVSAFRNHLRDRLGLEVREDRFTSSLFGEIDAPESRVNLLVGAKKFIEGWSSWRVSAMGLLNLGQGEGPQVIQLFGRGVRLKGKKMTLKRSARLPEEAPHPEGLGHLETLLIFGWNADYLQAFRAMLEQEDLGREVQVPVRTLFDPWPELPIPVPKPGYNAKGETWLLQVEPVRVSLDLTPRLTLMTGAGTAAGHLDMGSPVDFSDPLTMGLLDLGALYADLLEYKRRRGLGNVFIRPSNLPDVLAASELRLPPEDARDPARLQEGALRLAQTCLDRFAARREREAEGANLELGRLSALRESVVPYYTVRVTSDALYSELLALLQKPDDLYRTDTGRPLPRLHLDRHLYAPVLIHSEAEWAKDLSSSPPMLGKSERKFVSDLGQFWDSHHTKAPYGDWELHLLRNLPRVGVGFFRGSGFYPDFILWITDRKTGRQRVLFVKPHGLHHGGVEGNRSKIEALQALERVVSNQSPFKEQGILLGGYLLTDTALEQIQDIGRRNWEDLASHENILRQGGDYISRLLSG
jgi:hypothetical protein